MGYRARAGLPTAEAALQAVEREHPDLVLLDIHLACAMDGIDLAATLRRRHGPPVVYLTAYASDEVVERAKHTVPYGYLVKPFDERDLRTTVELALYKHDVELRLHHTLALQAAIFTHAAEAIAVLDLRGRVLDANRACERMTGYSHAEMIGLPVRALGGAPQDGTWPLRVGVLARGPGQRGLFRLRRRDGEVLDVEATASRLPGPPARLVCFLHDITDRRRAERELHKLNDELERRVAQRTAQLQRTASDLEAFARSVSHDLQGPAAGIRGLAQLLLEQHAAALPADAQRLVGMLARSGERLQQIIRDLLALARVQRIAPRPTPLDLAALMGELQVEQQALHPGRTLELVMPAQLPAWGDLQLMRVALGNVLANAWKYSRGRTAPRVEVRVQHCDTGQVISVTDNGAGFDGRVAAALFQPFQRLHDAAQFEGTGIGLATVRRAMDALGGWVWAEGRPDAGATIHLYLPHRCAAADEREPTPQRPGDAVAPA
jgi:PAS domain S-box-containing protein